MNLFWSSLTYLLPELLLLGFVILILIYALVESKRSYYKHVELTRILTYYGGAVCFFIFFFIWIFFKKLVVTSSHVVPVLIDFQVTSDYLAYSMKFFLFLFAGIIFMLSANYFRFEKKISAFEIPVIMLLSVLGMSILISANNFVLFYLALELQSLSIYVLIASRRDSDQAVEAALKYFILGAVSSGFLLLGISFLYGYLGSVSFSYVGAVIKQISLGVGLGGEIVGSQTLNGNLISGLFFSISLIFVGLLFKLSIAPFHVWVPDVYQKAPTPVVLFLAVLPKLSVWTLFFRLYFDIFNFFLPRFSLFMQVFALFSLFIGCFSALYQTRLKSLIAYSAIANMGFVLLGLSTFTTSGCRASLLYLIIYSIITMGNFAVILTVRYRYGEKLFRIKDVITLFYTHPFTGIVFAINVFSMAGIPPLAGFYGKFMVIQALIDSNMLFAAFLAVLFSTVSCFYYLRLIKLMAFEAKVRYDRYNAVGVPKEQRMEAFCAVDTEDDKEHFVELSNVLVIILFFIALFNVTFFLFPSPLLGAVDCMIINALGL